MDTFPDPAADEIIAEEDNSPPRNNFALALLRYNGWYIAIGLLFVCQVWKRILWPFVSRWMKTKEEDEKKIKKPKKENPAFKHRSGRKAAVEKQQKNYNEDILKMKKMAEEKELKKRQKYLAKLSEMSPGRKLNETYDPMNGGGEPTLSPPQDASGNRLL